MRKCKQSLHTLVLRSRTAGWYYSFPIMNVLITLADFGKSLVDEQIPDSGSI